MNRKDIVFGYHDHDLDGFMTGYLFNKLPHALYVYGLDYSGKNLLGEELMKDTDLLELSIKPKYFVFGDYCPSIEFLKQIVDDNENGRGEKKKVIIYDHHKNSYDKVINEFDDKYVESFIDSSCWDLESESKYIYYKYSSKDSGCKLVHNEMINKNSALSRLIGEEISPIYAERLIEYLVEDICNYDTWNFTKYLIEENKRIEFLKLIYYLQNYKTLRDFTNLIETKRKYPEFYDLNNILETMRNAGSELISNQITQNQRGIRDGKDLILGRFKFRLLSEGHPNYFILGQIREHLDMTYDGYVTYNLDLRNDKVTLQFRGLSDSEVNIPNIVNCYFGNGGGHEKAGSCQISLLEFTKILNNDWNQI